MAAQYLTPEQDEKIRQWERWNLNYFIFAFVALTIIQQSIGVVQW